MATLSIFGTLIDTEDQRTAPEDVTPTQVRDFLAALPSGEPVTLDITSYGGSVTAGLAIASMLR